MEDSEREQWGAQERWDREKLQRVSPCKHGQAAGSALKARILSSHSGGAHQKNDL